MPVIIKIKNKKSDLLIFLSKFNYDLIFIIITKWVKKL